MNNVLLALIASCVMGLVVWRNSGDISEPEQSPYNYHWSQRAFPYGELPPDALQRAVSWMNDQATSRSVQQLQWESVGPTNVGGRITDVAMHPQDLQTIYVATASGGVWKSSDAGENWFPITDALPTLNVGDIAIDPSDKQTIYCGTGEPNGGGGSLTYDGLGVYKSTDGGASWHHSGLEGTGSIGRIVVDPAQPNRIFVAAMGRLFSNNPQRGVFRSLDGGASWTKCLFVNDSVGAIDLAVHPVHTDTVFAVTWERTRRVNKRVYGGPGSALWRSTDGGDNWIQLTNGLPSGPNTGRMGIDISASAPNVLYLTAADKNGAFKGLYKSTDNGDNWTLVNPNDDPGYSSYGWWFGQVRVHPQNPNRVINMGIDWIQSYDGGGTWFNVSAYLHADYHALYIHPTNPDFWVTGNDGGVYISKDGGATWRHRPFPVTQFNTCEIDYQYPDHYSGGAQDYGTWAGVENNPGEWVHIFGGDGFVTLVNPQDSSIYYGEFQYGNLRSSLDINPPTSGRFNWNSPYIFDPNAPNVMYFGGERLYKSVDNGFSWTPISNDLSNGNNGMGVVYGTITSIAASPFNPQVLIVGTDDGNVWTTTDGGATWNKVSSSLPKRWVTRVVADLWNPKTAYVCFSGYRHGENVAHIYRTTDLGQTWTDVSGNLLDIPVNDLILDPLDEKTWYIATDAGVFMTNNGGNEWNAAGAGMPVVPVLDLTFHAPTRKLLAATFGRAMYLAVAALPSGAQAAESITGATISPNPFGEACSVGFFLNRKERIVADLFDLSGKRVFHLFDGTLEAGKQQLDFQGKDLPAGVYVLRVRGDGAQTGFTRKIVKSGG